MISCQSPILPETWNNSNQLMLNLIAPPENLSPEYFSSLLNQYGPVQQVKILNKSLMDNTVFVEMGNSESAKLAKQFLDKLSSNFIKCSYYKEDEHILFGSQQNNTSETICNTNSDLRKKQQQTSLNNTIQGDDLYPLSVKSLPLSQKASKSNQQVQFTKTLCLSGIKGKGLNAKSLYNIFSNFGNIDKILVIKIKNFAFVKYIKDDNAMFVQQNCQNLEFFDSTITISFTSDDSIDKLIGLNALYEQQDYYVGSEESDRFKFSNKMVLLPPSQVLHISNLKKVSSNTETMWDVFSEFGVVQLQKYQIHNLNSCIQQKWKHQNKPQKLWLQCIMKRLITEISKSHSLKPKFDHNEENNLQIIIYQIIKYYISINFYKQD